MSKAIPATGDEGPQTWHYGVVARWWAEFNTADAAELAYFRGAIERFGEPALDLACGTGRLLIPLLAAGLDVDGADLSPDMLALAREAATAQGLLPVLYASAMHELNLPRRYRTIYCCDSFGLGGHREHDRLALRRVFEQLDPGGALVFSHYYPYDDVEPNAWASWLPEHRADYPRPWPAEGDRRLAANGDEMELISRTADLDPYLQRQTLEMRAIVRRADKVVDDETAVLHENLYFAQELLLILELAGFGEVTIEGSYTGQPASPTDSAVVFVARRPA